MATRIANAFRICKSALVYLPVYREYVFLLQSRCSASEAAGEAAQETIAVLNCQVRMLNTKSVSRQSGQDSRAATQKCSRQRATQESEDASKIRSVGEEDSANRPRSCGETKGDINGFFLQMML